MYGRLAARLGLGLLVMSLLIRPAIVSRANRVGDDLAIGASGMLALGGVLVARLGGGGE